MKKRSYIKTRKAFDCLRKLFLFGALTLQLAMPRTACSAKTQTQSQHLSSPAEGQRIEIPCCLGKDNQWLKILFGSAENGVRFEAKIMDAPTGNHHYELNSYPTNTVDSMIALAWTGVGQNQTTVLPAKAGYCIRPDIAFYDKQEFENTLDAWNRLPGASQHEFLLEFRRTITQLETWIDGRFFAAQAWDAAWTNITLTASPMVRVASATSSESPETEQFLTLAHCQTSFRSQSFVSNLIISDKTSSLPMPPPPFKALPHELNTGLARWLNQEQDSDSFYDPYYRRSAWDNLPENILLRVPARFYNTAWLLVVVEPEKSPWMGVRIGRYRPSWDGNGPASLGDTNVCVNPVAPEGLHAIEQVGVARLQKNGHTEQLPVYRIAVALPTGAVADYLSWPGLDDGTQDWGRRLDWFDLEFTRKLETRVRANNGIFETKPLGPQNGVHILAVTLEKSPMEIRIESPESGFAFYKDQDPFLNIRTTNPFDKPMPIALNFRFSDFDGQDNAVGKTFMALPGDNHTEISLADLALGWYSAELSAGDPTGKTIWRQPLAFALLPPDTRLADNSSPYGTWWFKGSHYVEPNPDKILPLLRKMGFRHTTPDYSREKNTGAFFSPVTAAPYGITPSMCGIIRKTPPGKTLADVYREFFADWPLTRDVMIFHETSLAGLGLELPWELTGAPPLQLPDAARDRIAVLREHIATHVGAARSARPDARIVLGNGSLAFNTMWFREGLPRKFWDACGMETAIQTMHPEGQPNGWNLQSFWIAKRMRDIYGYTNMPITTCYEFDYRSTGPGGLAPNRQADWYARDVLMCLAYGSPNINVALIADCNSAYATSRWGSSGVFGRTPALFPKPAFVALSTLTLMLDNAVFKQFLRTGSTGLYAMEFCRSNNFAYAFWCCRGSRKVFLDASPNSILEACDSMGRPFAPAANNGALEITSSESPCYLLASKQIAIQKLGAPLHPEENINDFTILDPMESPANWKLAAPDANFQNACAYYPTVPGHIALGKGDADDLRLTLDSQPEIAPIISRYAIMEPAAPIPIEGKPASLGIWINGNSSWGRVYFEFKDARGRRWTSNGWEEEPGAWDMSDWEAETSINHDGWRFVSLPLPDAYPSGYYTPSFRHWRCQGNNSRTNTPEFPITFDRLYVAMREQVVYGTNMVPVERPWIELRDLSAIGSSVSTHGK